MPEQSSPRPSPDESNTTAALLNSVATITAELRHRRGRPKVDLDTALERDLGLDSLSRVELLTRLEREFGVSLPERVFADAETPRDLLRALESAGGGRLTTAPPTEAATSPGTARGIPEQAETLVDVLEWHAATHPDRPHIRLFDDTGDDEVITYRALHEEASAVANGLANRGLGFQEPVALMLPTGRAYFVAFMGVLLAGGIPVSLYPPASRRHVEDHLKRVRGILANCATPLLITDEAVAAFGRPLKTQVETLREVLTLDALTGPAQAGRPALGSGELAFLQYTSGTTGAPKGVMLSHANLLANIRTMGEAVQAGPDDVFVSWLPLYHDMGLIGAWLGSLYHAAPLVIMSPLAFMARPQRWLWAMHRYGGTLSAAPNFGYELCLRRLGDADLAGLDLSSWRISFNGAEPISPDTVERFCERFAAYGFRREAMSPVYGLAECAVGLAFPPLNRGPVIDRIDRETFMQHGRARPVGPDHPNPQRFVACGHALPGHEIRIVDEAGRELPDREQGSVQFRGPSATQGYYRNPDATRRLFAGADGQWLASGDLGYFAEGDLYLTGRSKDLIIRAGRNIYPQEIEQAVGDVDGVRTGNVAAFGSPDPDTGTERLIVLAETRQRNPQALEALRQRVNEVTAELSALPPDDVVLAAPNTVLKTSSGKIRRDACRQLYEQGRLSQGPAGRWQRWWTLARLSLAGVGPTLRKLRRGAGTRAFAAYAWAIYGLLALPVWPAILLLPRLSWRWAVMRAAGRLALWATRIPVSVTGLTHLTSSGRCVVVANHASYLDGYVLTTLSPRPLRFVAKAELAANPFAAWPLRRIGAEFVERFDRSQTVDDAQRLGERARGKHPLLFFPEGTFTRQPGLQPFRMGAFLAAAQAGLPVVPIAIRGTRSVLRSGSWMPRRAPITVTLAPPIDPGSVTDNEADTWQTAVALRDAARTAILRHNGEPDLVGAVTSHE